MAGVGESLKGGVIALDYVEREVEESRKLPPADLRRVHYIEHVVNALSCPHELPWRASRDLVQALVNKQRVLTPGHMRYPDGQKIGSVLENVKSKGPALARDEGHHPLFVRDDQNPALLKDGNDDHS